MLFGKQVGQLHLFFLKKLVILKKHIKPVNNETI